MLNEVIVRIMVYPILFFVMFEYRLLKSKIKHAILVNESVVYFIIPHIKVIIIVNTNTINVFKLIKFLIFISFKKV